MTNDRYQPWVTQKPGKLSKSSSLGYKEKPQLTQEEQIVKELAKLLAAGRRRAILIGAVAVAFTGLMGYRISRRPPIYSGSFQLLVEPVTIAENKLLSVLTQTLGETNSKTDSGLDYPSQIRVLRSPIMLGKIINQIQEQNPKYAYIDYDRLVKALKIERIMEESEGTRILEISYISPNPLEVKFVLEKLKNHYIDYSRENRKQKISDGIRYIEGQIQILKREVSGLQARRESLRKQYQITDPDMESRYIFQQSLDLEGKRRVLQSELADARAHYTTLKQLYDDGSFVTVLQDFSVYNGLIQQLHQVESEIIASEVRLQDEHPTLKALKNQQQDLQQRVRVAATSIIERVGGEMKGLENQERLLAIEANRVNQRAQLYPMVARQYEELQRELQVSTDALNQLVAKRDNLAIDEKQEATAWEALSEPEQPKASSPLTTKKLILLSMVGLVLGLGAGLLAEILNNVFHSPEEVEDETNLQLLGVIPFAKELKKFRSKGSLPSSALVPVTAPAPMAGSGNLLLGGSTPEVVGYASSPMMEAFRALYTNIRLLSPETPIRSLAIGAATAGEGKSTIALQLAQTAAAIGQRVLLVDGDMRSPKIHEKLELPNLRGLSDAIATDISLNEVIQKSPTDDNLFVLTAGSIPSDPIKLLSSKKMHSLMEQFQDFFDLTIYDSPPLVGLADASLLAAQTDGLVMVVGIDKTDRNMVLKALDGLKISGSPVLGIVANGIKGYTPKSYAAKFR
uniref:non-specific protein-tyrosine kinase n=1 Tax=Planktothricoides sp. SpSt-374 TaxID=2282167 RepID=A0A7C3VGP3_9CYAN